MFTPTCFDMCHPQGVSRILVPSCVFRHVILGEFQKFWFPPTCFDMCHPQGVSRILVPSYVFRHVSSSGSFKNFGSFLRVSTCVILREFQEFWFPPTCFDMCHPQGVSKILVPSCVFRHVSSSGSFKNFSGDRRTDITKLIVACSQFSKKPALFCIFRQSQIEPAQTRRDAWNSAISRTHHRWRNHCSGTWCRVVW